MKIGKHTVTELTFTLDNGSKIIFEPEQGSTIKTKSNVNPFTEEEREYLSYLYNVLFPTFIT